jgi:hypothetical protein
VAGRLEDVPTPHESRRRRSSQKPVSALAFRLFGWMRRHQAPFGNPRRSERPVVQNAGVRNAKGRKSVWDLELGLRGISLLQSVQAAAQNRTVGFA